MGEDVPREVGSDQPVTGRLVDLARDGRVATITLNRPEKLNAINDDLLSGMHQVLAELASDEEVEVVVLTGAGRAFCAGFDISRADLPKGTGQHAATSEAYWSDHFRGATEMLLGIWDLPQPLVAKVRGACLGGGMHLLLGCDLRIAAEDAFFGEPEIELGGVPSFPLLAMNIAPCLASEVLLGGERLTARRAAEIGLINRVVPGSELDAETAAFAARLARVPKGSLRRAKRVTHRVFDLMGLRQAVAFGADVAVEAMTHRSGELAEFDQMVDELGVAAALAWLRSGSPTTDGEHPHSEDDL